MTAVRSINQGRVFSLGLLVLTLSLVLANIYLFIKTRSIEIHDIDRVAVGFETDGAGGGKLEWNIYRNELYGYTVSYPKLLEPRTVENERYESFLIFFVPGEIDEPGFAISVRKNTLNDEISLIREEIGEGSVATLINEEEIEEGGFGGFRLDYEPKNIKEGEARSIIIINNGRYSYSLSSTPEFLEKVIEKFSLDS